MHGVHLSIFMYSMQSRCFEYEACFNFVIASSDFVPFDNIVWIWSDRQCYHLDILNDNISEPVESFQVSLDAAITGQDVVFINQTLTVYVSDDGEISSSVVNAYPSNKLFMIPITEKFSKVYTI